MGSQRLFEGFHLLCPKNTSGPLSCLPFRCCCWLPVIFGALVLEGQGEAATLRLVLQLRFLPFLGDVGSFLIKLVEDLQGQMWSSDWAEELRKADQQKEQTYRSVWVEWTQQE